MTTQYNVVTYGNLTNTNGVLSGFSANNYATIPLTFNPVQHPYEIVFKVNTETMPTNANGIIWQTGDVLTSRGRLDLEVYEDKLYSELGANDDLVWSMSGITTLSSDTDYWIKLTYDGVDTYGLYLSIDGTTWTTEGTVTSSGFLGDGTAEYNIIGVQHDEGGMTSHWFGSIDLNESYININGIRWWQGATSVSNVQTRIQLRHDTAANWASVNPILLVGEVGIETDTRKQKFGDGTTAWNSLSYSNGDMKQNVLTAGSNIQINGDTISATNTTYSAMTVSEGTTGTATTARTMRADRLKSIIHGTKLTGLDTNYYTPITATDSILSALGKLQVGVDDANSMYDYKADDFVPDSPLIQYWENIGIDFAEGVGEIDTDSILSSNTDDGWCNGELPEIQSTNLIDDYWEWSGMFRSANISLETEAIGVDGVSDNGFIFHIKSNGDIINPDDNNKVLANVYFNDWVRFTIIHQAGETNITTTFDNAQGGTTTTTTALATTSPQSINNVAWRLNVSPKIDYVVGIECYFRTIAGGTKYFFTKRHIGVDNKAFDGQWTNNTASNIVNGSNITWTSGHNYDLSSYLPNDGKIYEVIFTASWNGSTAGSNHELRAGTDIITSAWNWLGRVSGQNAAGGTCILPVGSGRYVKLTTAAKACNAVYFSALGYRRLGTNS